MGWFDDSWLSDFGSWIGSAFTDSDAPSNSSVFTGTDSPITSSTVFTGTDSPSSEALGGGLDGVVNGTGGKDPKGFNFLDSDFLGGLITAGSGLAGSYFQNSSNSEQNAANMEMAANQLAFERERLAQNKELAKAEAGAKIAAAKIAAKIAANAALGVAKKNNLGALYQNYASLKQKGGESEAQSAQETGRLMTNPIIARLGVLK